MEESVAQAVWRMYYRARLEMEHNTKLSIDVLFMCDMKNGDSKRDDATESASSESCSCS